MIKEILEGIGVCSICAGDKIKGDLVSIGCGNDHHFCLSCLLQMAKTAKSTKALACPNCREKNICLSYSKALNTIRDEVENTAGPNKTLALPSLSSTHRWQDLKKLSQIAHRVFPVTFPEDNIGNTLEKKQLLILAKNYMNLYIIFKNDRPNKLYSLTWVDERGNECPPEKQQLEEPDEWSGIWNLVHLSQTNNGDFHSQLFNQTQRWMTEQLDGLA